MSILAGAFGGLIAGIFFLLFAGPAAMSSYGAIVGYTVTGWMWLMAAMTVPTITVGIGLLYFQPWARSIGTVVAIIQLLNFPVGTLLGLYALWIFLSEEADPLFNPRFAKRRISMSGRK